MSSCFLQAEFVLLIYSCFPVSIYDIYSLHIRYVFDPVDRTANTIKRFSVRLLLQSITTKRLINHYYCVKQLP